MAARKRARKTYIEPGDLRSELEDGIVIRDARGGGYSVTASGRFIDNGDDMREALRIAAAWAKRNNYYPNLFYVNDHGNVDLINSRGRVLESWV